MGEKKIRITVGDVASYWTVNAPIPADDEWHDVEMRLKVRKSKDGEHLWIGPNNAAATMWRIDGEHVAPIREDFLDG